MSALPRRYWAIRTDRNNESLLLAEVRVGRLRQGWGYEAKQDLRVVQAEISRGGNWWERITIEQKEVLPHLRMLANSDDSVQIGDWILIPNLPKGGLFLIAEVTGDYYFDPLKLSDQTDANDLGQDYGHVLPIRLLTETGVNRYAEVVDARIRSTLRTPMRMWNLDGYKDAIDWLINAHQAGAEISSSMSGTARLDSAWRVSISHASNELQSRLITELDARFQAAEWEEPIVQVLGHLYASAEIRWVGGPQEHGADVVVQIPNHFGPLPWLILVQVKNYQGEIGPAVIGQLRNAYDHYSREGTILSVVVLTTADRMSPDLACDREALEGELKTPIQFLLRKETVRLLSNGLLSRMTGERGLID